MLKRSLVFNVLLVLCSLAVGVLASEGAAQLYVAYVAKEGKLFAPHTELGWAPLPHLDLERKNSNGKLWRVVTDAAGIRGPSDWQPDREIRMLVLGDSFAFGEGVDLEDRFDTILGQRFDNLSVVNLGVIGYGPTQELIRARGWLDRLRLGDVALLLTYGNDFLDLAKTTHAGRSKPWVERRGGRLIEHPPEIGLVEILRDRSYLFSVAARTFNTDHLGRYQARLREAGEVYRDLVLRAARPLVERGVLVVLVHHGDQVFELPFSVADVFAAVCPELSGCLALDPLTGPRPRGEIFLSDGHWAPGGHRLAAEAMASYLRTLDGLGPRLQDERGPDVAHGD